MSTVMTSYKPLGLAQVSEIRDIIEVYNAYPEITDEGRVRYTVEAFTELGFDPRDVRQAAEEALENLRAE